ncbi:butyrophilin 2 [Labeo rohita]|uniref:Butyrophilin 2 n=1 Tax=Labeo rohita TaxID=84645 RepID=A0A498NQX2_LABRO|nr:butyrophilin 2 [Labeo rohita]
MVAPLGSSVVLPCSVDQLLSVKGLEVEWRKTDTETLVHLYQDGESQTEAQEEDYQDRAHLFTEEIQCGNFSLRLDNLRAEDEGQYTCTVQSQEESGETVVEIKVDVERLRVSGSSRSISASAGADVTLSCSVDSHITPEDIEEVSWMKTDEVEEIMVLLYQNNEALPEASDERYRDRVEFFTDEIPKGNFSLRLKSVRTEDKGVYMCEVSAGGLSANTTAVLEQLEILVSGKYISLGGSVDLPCQVNKSLLENNLKVEWRRAENLVHLYEDGTSQADKQHEDYHKRAHFLKKKITDGNFSLHLDKLRAGDEGFYSCKVYRDQNCLHTAYAELKLILVTEVGKKSGRIITIFNIVADMTFEILPTLQFMLLFYTFGSAGAEFIMIILPVLLMMTNDRWFERCYDRLSCSFSVIRTTMLIFIIVTNVVMIGVFIFTLDNKTDFRRFVPVYVFGSVVVVLLNSAALITELILKTENSSTEFPQLCVHVVTDSCDKGKHSDSHSSDDPDRDH